MSSFTREGRGDKGEFFERGEATIGRIFREREGGHALLRVFKERGI